MPAPRIPVVCNECGKKTTVSATNADPSCPRCGGVDLEVRS
jgi:predicted RNA-binding Zn-ribbon protein involved in translation (DUF1610 family)